MESRKTFSIIIMINGKSEHSHAGQSSGKGHACIDPFSSKNLARSNLGRPFFQRAHARSSGMMMLRNEGRGL